MKRFLAIFLLILALCAALFVTMSVSFVSKGPEAVDGVLDYRGTDFTSSVYQLDGQWEFYYGSLYAPEEFKQGTPKGRELITLPGSWAGLGYPVLGHATYRLTLQTDPGEIYLLFIPEIISSAVIWNNGTEIYRAGQVGDSAANTVTGVRNELLAVSSEDGTLELVVWAANYHLTDSGLFYPILLGRDPVMLHHLLWQRAAAAAAMGGILLIGVYHLFLYLFRRMERLYLVYSVTCVVTVLRLVMETNSMVQYFCRDGLTFFLSRVYLLLFALHSICICLFMLEAFSLRLSRLHRRVVMACFALPVLGVFLLPNTAAVAGLFLALIPNGLAAALALRSGKVGRDPYRLLYLFSLVLFIIYAPLTKTVLEAKLYIPGAVSNLFLILSQCVMLSRSYADAHEQVERVNENLERIVEERTAQLNDTNRQLSASQAALREMISNISHDLKTPITAIKGYVEGIMDGVADTPEKMDRYIKTVYNKANDMNVLINELSLYSKIDSNIIPYNFEKININSYFKDCVDEIGADLEQRGMMFSYRNYCAANVMVTADPEQLKRVINNIINNACKYNNKAKGKVGITLTEYDRKVQVAIKDNGIGISKEDLPHIFRRTYRADMSRNSAGGSGLGLSICKKIIEEHGGEIWAESKLRAGTTIFFTLNKVIDQSKEK